MEDPENTDVLLGALDKIVRNRPVVELFSLLSPSYIMSDFFLALSVGILGALCVPRSLADCPHL